ncbi:MAG TPA: hypothetical protein VHV83_16765 [Armatimonadota bacterium]|nr:hypothetical protein [Armatimonadota bacterium]
MNIQQIPWDALTNPVMDFRPTTAVRDPALLYHDGMFHCFYTAVERRDNRYHLSVDAVCSRDLQQWSTPRRLFNSPELNFSSPGNVLRIHDRWVMCLQSYPTPPGITWGTDDSRLWLSESDDLIHWTPPHLLKPEGAQVHYASSPRQIDPFLVEHEEKFWCCCKVQGAFALLVSTDLLHWEEASPERPILSSADTPDGATVENPCIIRDGDTFVLFFAPCRDGRGIGMARSNDLLHWHDVHYLSWPDLPWAPGGPTAPMVVDLRTTHGKWLMAFHGDDPRNDPHDAALGIAWSDDLTHWVCPSSPAHTIK